MDRGGRRHQPVNPPLRGGEGLHGFVSRIRYFFQRKQRSLATVGIRRYRFSEWAFWKNFGRGVARQRGIGLLGVVVLFSAVGSYGATLGGHWPQARTLAFGIPDAFAQAAGFRIDSVSVDGRQALTDQEIIQALNFGEGRSLLFLNVADAREKLIANPLVKEATVRKLYPNNLHIVIEEREPFALWQRDGKLVVVAADGTIIDEVRDGRFSDLPLIVGSGADKAAPAFLAALKQYPDLMEKVYASVWVGNRRWNLRLTSGIDVKLPQQGYEQALELLANLDKTQQLADRDVIGVDLRLPWRAVVRLSDTALEAEAKAAKEAKKGGRS